MSKVVINIESHEQKYTVREMRRRLAQVLSKLDGGQEVSFNFTATLENYQATPQARAITMHPALGALYNLSPTGLAAYASRMANANPDPYQRFVEEQGITRAEAKARVLAAGYGAGQVSAKSFWQKIRSYFTRTM